jgi:HK97 family phage portal protein
VIGLKFIDRLRLATRIVTNSRSEEARKFFAGEDSAMTDMGTETVDRDFALRNTAVFSAVRVSAETMGSIPIMVYRKTKDGRELDEKSNIYEIFHEVPNSEMTCQALKESGMMALNLGGNAFFQKLKNKYGQVVEILPIDWTRVQIERDKTTGRLVYRVQVDAETKTYTRDDVFHIPAFSWDGICGLTPITYCAGAIILGKQYESYNKHFFKNGAFTSGVLEFPNPLTDTSFTRLKTDFEASYVGLINAGKPIILEDGGKFNPLKMSQADAQFIESTRFQLEEVARIYRVPLSLLQDFGRATWNNMEQQQLFFVMFHVLPWAKRWEENIRTQIMTPEQRKAGLYPEFNLNTLLRGDAKTRAELYASARQWGWLSPNDIRRLENLNPIPNGDVYSSPVNMTELGNDPLDMDDKNGEDIEDDSNVPPSGGSAARRPDVDERLIEQIYNLITRKEGQEWRSITQ